MTASLFIFILYYLIITDEFLLTAEYLLQNYMLTSNRLVFYA